VNYHNSAAQMAANSIIMMRAICFIAIVPDIAAKSAFLQLVNSNATIMDAESKLLTELANAAKHSSARLKELQESLRPLYNAIPKEEDGRASHSVVIYMLHRFFSRSRGWTIRGLEPAGASRNTSAEDPASVEMKGWMPAHLQNFLEDVVGSKSLSLREIAVFAATLEDFIQKEEHQWLEEVYHLLGRGKTERISKNDFEQVLETYLKIYNLDGNMSSANPSDIKKMLPDFAKRIPGWGRMQEFVRNVVRQTWLPTMTSISFDEVLPIVQDIGEHYSVVYDNECANMKKQLLNIESKKPGRVRLTDFYKVTLNGGVWEFNEKIGYLRAFGALDESDPKTPLVVIPNYMGGKQNCLTASGYYALCCRNECEEMMESMERSVVASTAYPSQILSLVEDLSSRINGNKTLPLPMIDRLERVALLNGGKVPLHGRLFAQWMHHMFPRECAYPHESGTTAAMTPDEWMKETGHEESTASTEEMLEHVRQDTCRFTPVGISCGQRKGLLAKASQASTSEEDDTDQDLPWSEKEELLVVVPPTRQATQEIGHSYLKDFFVFITLASMIYVVVQPSRSLMSRVWSTDASRKTERCNV
jgi:hypothetical protein